MMAIVVVADVAMTTALPSEVDFEVARAKTTATAAATASA